MASISPEGPSQTEGSAFISPSDREKLRTLINKDDPKTWNTAWQAKITPWDGGDFQPPLRDVIESGEIAFPRAGRALVPGCGAGYDVIYIASTLGLDTLGLDVADTALEIASKHLASKETPPAGKVKFEQGDFFNFKLSEPLDLVYDYTFFVAIPPSLRPDWGRQMTSLLKPGGYLITLVFPIEPYHPGGPPHFVRVEHYTEVLGENFVKVLDKVPAVSMETHVGHERIVVWQRV